MSLDNISDLPAYRKDAFICPFCRAYTHMFWTVHIQNKDSRYSSHDYYNLLTAKCQRCSKDTIWYDEKMIVPLNTGLPSPHKDMPEEVKVLYEESAQIYNISRRASLALLRLAIERLTIDLAGDSNDKLFERIGKLKSKNIINDQIQEAFDSFRVIGNDAIHPGQIVLNDNSDHSILFRLLNYMVDIGIAKPLEIRRVFESSVSSDQKDAIKKRDLKSA